MPETKTEILCMECDAVLELPEDPVIGEVTACAECNTELEIVATDPVLLELAPEIEEDWGE